MRWPPLLSAGAGLATGVLLLTLLPEALLFAPAPAPDIAADTGTRYACPMMDFIARRPGDCPVCGMRMAPVEAGELNREQQDRMGLELVRVIEGPATVLVRAHGIARYDERTFQAVVPRVAGRVVRRYPAALHPGTLVRAGDPVIDLFSPEVFAAQGELAAALKLADAHAIHALVERFLRWQLPSVAQAVIAGGAPVDTVTLASPYAGVVLPGGPGNAGLPEVGTELAADAVLLRLADPEARIIALQVPETRARWLRAGQTVVLATEDGHGTAPPPAQVAWIAPTLNPDLRAREVHLHVQAVDDRLPPGSIVEARLSASLAPDLTPADPTRPETAGRFTLVPRAALLSTGVRHVVWRVAARLPDGRIRLELAPVALGPRLEAEDGGDFYVVRHGVRPGDEVAARGAFLIDSQAQLAGQPSLLFPAGLPVTGTPSAP
ncbi:MAG: efflux RND transporter periplasmic adaptor subunit [Opitutaceae bacterium]